MKTRLIRHSLFVFIVVMLISGCQSGLLSSGKGRAFHLVFEDAQGITAGTPLVYQGVTIGDVTDVKLITPQSVEPTAPCQLDAAQLKQIPRAQVACVSVLVSPANQHLVKTKSDFVIRRSALLSLPDQKHIQMTVWDSASPVLPANTTVVGCKNMLDFYWRQLKQMGNRGLVLGEMSIHTEFDATGPVTRTYLLETSRYLPTEMLLEGLLPTEVGWEVTRPEQEEAKILHIVRAFPSPQSVSDVRSQIAFTSQQSLFGAEYQYAETFVAGQFAADYRTISGEEWKTTLTDWYNHLSAGEEDLGNVIGDIFGTVLGQLRAYATPLSRVPVVITVRLPANIVAQESNAHFVTGDQASWIVSVEDLNQGFVARAIARKGSAGATGKGMPAGVTAGGIVLLMGGIAVGIWLWQKKRASDRLFDIVDEDSFSFIEIE